MGNGRSQLHVLEGLHQRGNDVDAHAGVNSRNDDAGNRAQHLAVPHDAKAGDADHQEYVAKHVHALRNKEAGNEQQRNQAEEENHPEHVGVHGGSAPGLAHLVLGGHLHETALLHVGGRLLGGILAEEGALRLLGLLAKERLSAVLHGRSGETGIGIKSATEGRRLNFRGGRSSRSLRLGRHKTLTMGGETGVELLAAGPQRRQVGRGIARVGGHAGNCAHVVHAAHIALGSDSAQGGIGHGKTACHGIIVTGGHSNATGGQGRCGITLHRHLIHGVGRHHLGWILHHGVLCRH